jgi:hypothetical protein
MSSTATFPIDGGCDCGYVRYRMAAPPLYVHCCHCRWCQRESGASFALNALLEADHVATLQGQPEVVHTPTASGAGQRIARCPKCRIALWSHYSGFGPWMKFVRVGTLDDPDTIRPDIHIHTSSKQPWVVLPQGSKVKAQYYDLLQEWPPESLVRLQSILPQIREYRAALKEQRGGA